MARLARETAGEEGEARRRVLGAVQIVILVAVVAALIVAFIVFAHGA